MINFFQIFVKSRSTEILIVQTFGWACIRKEFLIEKSHELHLFFQSAIDEWMWARVTDYFLTTLYIYVYCIKILVLIKEKNYENEVNM